MKRPPRQSLKVAKAVLLPHHPLSDRLRKALKSVDAVHSPPNLKPMTVIMDKGIQGAEFNSYSDTGPYEILLNPNGTHPELSLLHEVGHYLEWQTIPKSHFGPRDFEDDLLFAGWLAAVFVSPTVQRLTILRGSQPVAGVMYNEINYFLKARELWARAYSQYIASKTLSAILSQQVAAENKVVRGTMTLRPYWQRDEFLPIQSVMDSLFEQLGWLK